MKPAMQEGFRSTEGQPRHLGNKDVSVEVLDVQETIHKEDVTNLYKYI